MKHFEITGTDSRDVRVAWASSVNAFPAHGRHGSVPASGSSLYLAQGRYTRLSSSSELTQGAVECDGAEIENLSAKYDYQSQ